MRVSYALVVSRESMDFVPESEIESSPELYSERLSRGKTVHIGKIALEEEDRRLALADEMGHIAVALCFGALKPLLSGEAVEYRIMQTGQVIPDPSPRF